MAITIRNRKQCSITYSEVQTDCSGLFQFKVYGIPIKGIVITSTTGRIRIIVDPRTISITKSEYIQTVLLFKWLFVTT